jgi:putative heme-binding domain-containing protein
MSRCVLFLFLAAHLIASHGIKSARAEDAKAAAAAAPVVGLSKRVPWTTPGITGSPEPPLPYRAKNAFEKLKFNNPTAVAQVPGSDRLMVTEEKGKVYSFPNRPDAENPDLVIDLAASAPGLDHIFDITFHPKFAENRFCYIVYALQPKLPDGTRISRFKVSETTPPVIDPASEEIVITWISGGHNGCSLQFGPDGMLYFSAGDSGENFPPDGNNTGQRIDDLCASIMRIDVDHPAKESKEPGQPAKLYSIPADNPFVDVPGARGEIWAYGLRNPWRMCFDADGTLWVADVGWEVWEMIYHLKRGGNYGWSITEGSQPVASERPRGPQPIEKPFYEHSHNEARSITGGYISTGDRLPELKGAYVYGDFVTGKMWAMWKDGNRVGKLIELADTPLGIVSFGVDSRGEVLILDYSSGTLSTLERQPPASVNRKFPRTLSQTGLFADTARHITAPGVLPYAVSAEAWADGTTSRRFFGLPEDTKLSVYTGNNPQQGTIRGKFQFPTDGVLAKTVGIETRPGDPTSWRRIETQIFHFNGADWAAYSYVWNDAQTDAELAPAEGTTVALTIQNSDKLDAGKFDLTSNGGTHRQTYRVASRTECLLCHSTRGGSIYGFIPGQLNRDFDYAVAGSYYGPAGDKASSVPAGRLANQLATYAHLGLFAGPVDQAASPYPNPYDESVDLTQRVRSYLHMNCYQCHLRGGGGSSDFETRFDMPLEKTKLVGSIPKHGDFGIDGAEVVRAGDPTRSVLYYRIAKLGRGRMPHFGSDVVDPVGLKMVGDWIAGLSAAPAADAPSPAAAAGDLSAAGIVKALESTAGAVSLVRALETEPLDLATRRRIVVAGAAHGDPRIRDLFERFIPEEQRTERLGTDIDAAKLLAVAGDAARGAAIFHTGVGVTCRNCHRIGSEGPEVGPSLEGVGRKLTKPQLLESLLQPSKTIDPKYVTWTLVTEDGDVHSGLMVEKTADRVTLRDAQNRLHTVASADIQQLQQQPQSLMPEQLLRDMTRQEAADLLEFLARQQAAPAASP